MSNVSVQFFNMAEQTMATFIKLAEEYSNSRVKLEE